MRTFTFLADFILNTMKMRHVYQPIMLRTLVERGGIATVAEIAQAFTTGGGAKELAYCKGRAKFMVGQILRLHGIVQYEDGVFSIRDFDEMTGDERREIIAMCYAKIAGYLEKHPDPWTEARDGFVERRRHYDALVAEIHAM